jgi:hypothetical protein
MVGLLTLFSVALPTPAHALSFENFSIPGLSKIDLSEQQKALFSHLETEVVPQIEQILSPIQSEQLKAAIADGTSFRKAFKAITLTPEQKTQLAGLLKSLPKKDILASLTPEQKKAFFLKKKEMFIPTPEEITERISSGIKNAEGALPDTKVITEKIKQGLEKKASFMPSIETITEKIKQAMPEMVGEE